MNSGEPGRPTKRHPSDDAELGRAFYADLDPELEVGHFTTMWHLVSLGHLITRELDRIARRHDLSGADLLLLGTLRVADRQSLRATDVAFKLHVSNAVLSSRVARLVRMKLLTRAPSPSDRRSFELTLTGNGARRVDQAVAEISREGRFAQRHLKLSREDREQVRRLLGVLHDLMDRDFIPAARIDR